MLGVTPRYVQKKAFFSYNRHSMSLRWNILPPSVEKEDTFQIRLPLILFGLRVQNVQVNGHPQNQAQETLPFASTRRSTR